jgi:hypothetical protein
MLHPPIAAKTNSMKAPPPVVIATRNWTRLLQLLAVSSLTLLAAGCREQQSRELPPNVIARVGDQDITRATFEQELQRRSRGAPDRFAAPKAKLALLEELIRAEALYQQALTAGYDQNPELIADFKRILAAKYQEDQLASAGATSSHRTRNRGLLPAPFRSLRHSGKSPRRHDHTQSAPGRDSRRPR